MLNSGSPIQGSFGSLESDTMRLVSESVGPYDHLFPFYDIRVGDAAVIFLHGLASDSALAWNLGDELHSTPRQVALRTGASVFCCDWPTDAFSRFWTLEDGANHVMDSFRFAYPYKSTLKKLVLVGHSMGGLVSLEIAARIVDYLQQMEAPLEALHLELLATPTGGSMYGNLLARLPDKIRPEYVDAIRTDSKKVDLLVSEIRIHLFNGIGYGDRKIRLTGREIMEGSFFKSFLGRKVPKLISEFVPAIVKAEKEESIFPNPRRLPQSDHRSITDFLISGHIVLPDLESVLST